MSTHAIRSDWAGQVIDGRFTLLQWLGGSESSGVFLTELPGSGSRKAAIKLIPADACDAEARIAGWAAASTLSHPHLMRLFYFGRCQIGAAPLLYVVTEYAEEILSQILPQRPLTPAEATEMLDSVLDALSYLHEKGFVHGRLKPSNLMAVDDQLKLSCDDLQIAGEPRKRLPAAGAYDAPEVAAGIISPAADLWSLGVTLVESLTQRPPVRDRAAQSEPVVPDSIPEPIAGIAREALRLNPRRRCTLANVKARLKGARVLSHSPGRAALARLRAPALIAAVLVLFAIVAGLLLRSRRTEPLPPPLPPAAVEQPAPVVAVEQPAPAAPALPPPSPAPQIKSSPETQRLKGVPAKGSVAEQVLPDVPTKASKTIRGAVQVSVRVTVDPGGDVSSAVLDSPSPSKYFANLALKAAQRWKFNPPQVNGQAVSSVWVLRFAFAQTGPGVTPVEVSP